MPLDVGCVGSGFVMTGAAVALSSVLVAWAGVSAQERIEKWGIFELALPGPSSGNPFIGTSLSATFENGGRTFRPEGFYDGNGLFKIGLMPDREGVWTYETRSNRDQLDGRRGRFFLLMATPSPELQRAGRRPLFLPIGAARRRA
jgi:hypothetical protein